MSEQANNLDQSAIDEGLIRLTLKIAQSAVEHGNHPFGALLADKSGKVVLEAENRVTTGKDYTAHAETELIRKAGSEIPSEILKDLTLYTSTEPCVMCSGAICWSGLKRVVYGCPETTLQIYAGKYLSVPCRDTFTRCANQIEVTGPILEEEASKLHSTFWSGYDEMQRKHV